MRVSVSKLWELLSVPQLGLSNVKGRELPLSNAVQKLGLAAFMVFFNFKSFMTLLCHLFDKIGYIEIHHSWIKNSMSYSRQVSTANLMRSASHSNNITLYFVKRVYVNVSELCLTFFLLFSTVFVSWFFIVYYHEDREAVTVFVRLHKWYK